MTPVLVFDLETIPDATALRRLNGWNDERSDAEVVEAALIARQASHGNEFLPLHLHQVAAIGCVFRDDNGLRVRSLGAADDPEPALLKGFFRTIDRYTPTLVSWNGCGFDLPVLHYRCLINGVQAPRYWDTGARDREFRYNNYLNRYHTRHVDLMDVLAAFNARANAPLDDLAKLCGFPGKLGMDGSQVWRAWSEGRADEVRAYCETDVVNTWLVYCRYQYMTGEFDRETYESEVQLVRDTLAALAADGATHWAEYMAAWSQA